MTEKIIKLNADMQIIRNEIKLYKEIEESYRDLRFELINDLQDIRKKLIEEEKCPLNGTL